MHPTSRLSRTTVSVTVLVLLTAGSAGCSATSGSHVAVPADGGARQSSDASPSGSPLPTFDPATRVGDYAPGFPVELLGAPDDTTVLASSAVPQEDEMVEVSLNLTTTLPTDQVVARIAERLEAADFDEADPDDLSASDLAANAAYTRMTGTKNPRLESVQLGVLDRGDARLVSVSGIVRSPTDE